MRRSVSFLLGALPALALVSMIAVSGASAEVVGPGAGAIVKSLKSGNWSDPSVWSGGVVPSNGDLVVVDSGAAIVYDTLSEAAIGNLSILGSLVFSRTANTNLDVGDITVYKGGYLEIGLPDQPIPPTVQARIRFVNKKDGEHSLTVMGEAQIHGAPRQHVYSRLARLANRGDKTIQLAAPVDWKPGDHIVIATTTANPMQTEENDVAGVEGTTVVLRAPLRFRHEGASPVQAEVAMLTRNVLITSKDPARRGHTMFVHGARGSISYAEFRHLGGEGQLGKYPIHFHMVGDSMKGSYVKGVSVWNSGNRFITLHSTQHVTLSNNVGYRAVGHGFFLEAGDEVHNTLDHNLGILVTQGEILRSDTYASLFWTQNPLNVYTNNVAVAGRRGFDFAIPNMAKDIPGVGLKVNLRSLPILKFENNVAHSNTVTGLRIVGVNTAGDRMTSTIAGFQGWRNSGEAGVMVESNAVLLSQPLLFGNQKSNLVLSGSNNKAEGGKVLGELPEAPASLFKPSAKGIVVGGRGNVVSGVWLEGHDASNGYTPADVSLVQDSERPVQAVIEDTVMKSRRPIVFGYPQNDQSYLEVKGYQGQAGNDFLLYRLDARPAGSCLGTLDIGFVANKCVAP